MFQQQANVYFSLSSDVFVVGYIVVSKATENYAKKIYNIIHNNNSLEFRFI